MEGAVAHYAERLKENDRGMPKKFSNRFQRLSANDANFLESSFTVDEVKDAVWSCAGSKAPGPDGLQPFLHSFNPEKSDPQGFLDYQLISLIGCVYKVLSKILALRLAKVISSIIGPNQIAFLSGRQILDGVLIANEIIQMANIEDHKLLLFKVDFEKAFDRVCWSFLRDIMVQMGFGVKWLMWMNSCLSSVLISVLLNGAPSKEFKMERGIYHTKGGDYMSRIQYADDALFFGKWSRSNANTLIHILNCFEEESSLKVNLAKSRIFRIGVDIEEVKMVSSSLGCTHDSIPFLYLGLPVGKKMHICEGWDVVINRIREWLSA
ncbi:putative RNA-directed DNA polymerase, eukaryota, reverse transcriptase zinc-binding domain protein [Tanacetum coccineum]